MGGGDIKNNFQKIKKIKNFYRGVKLKRKNNGRTALSIVYIKYSFKYS